MVYSLLWVMQGLYHEPDGLWSGVRRDHGGKSDREPCSSTRRSSITRGALPSSGVDSAHNGGRSDLRVCGHALRKSSLSSGSCSWLGSHPGEDTANISVQRLNGQTQARDYDECDKFKEGLG